MLPAPLFLALLAPWAWDPVALNCRGGQESGVVYIVTQIVKEPDGFVALVREDLVAEPAFPQEDVYVPGPGAATFIDVQAADAADNVSLEGWCP